MCEMRKISRKDSCTKDGSDANVEAGKLREVRTSHRSGDQGRHLTRLGLAEIAEIAETMNHRKPSEVLRILRDHTPTISPFRGEMKRWSGPYGDVGRPAETSGPPIE